VATPARIERAARRAIEAKHRGRSVVMVVSAMGHTTDELLALARQISRNPPTRELDMLLTTGEQVSIALMAMAIAELGEKAISLTAAQVGLLTDSVHARARIRRIHKTRIEQELAQNKIVICAGFQGVDEGGELTTLGRGASDTTAAALAAVLGAEICEIYTDVDGIYTADPRRVPAARKLETIGYDEMLEMAALGAQVMHSRAVEFGKKYNVPIHVRNSQSEAPGTMITATTPGMEDIVVRGAALKEDLAACEFIDVPNHPGMASTIFGAIGGRQIVVDDIFQNVHSEGRLANVGFTVDAGDAPAIRDIAAGLKASLPQSKLSISERISKVSVIGIGMRSHSGVAGLMFKTLADGAINIRNISTSEIVISCMVAAEDGERALRLLHAAFGLDQQPTELGTSDGCSAPTAQRS
jgi:aspartate kinase